MPFVAFCKMCEEHLKREKPSNDDNSIAYMIAPAPLHNIESKIVDHFKRLHDIDPKPDPYSLSWKDDFKKVLFELPQYGDVEHELILPFRGPSVRHFKGNNYNISVITRHDYDECMRARAEGRRIDITLFYYNYPHINYL